MMNVKGTDKTWQICCTSCLASRFSVTSTYLGTSVMLVPLKLGTLSPCLELLIIVRVPHKWETLSPFDQIPFPPLILKKKAASSLPYRCSSIWHVTFAALTIEPWNVLIVSIHTQACLIKFIKLNPTPELSHQQHLQTLKDHTTTYQ